MKTFNKIIICLAILALFLPVVSALTASIGNARMVLHTEVEDGDLTNIYKAIKVNNVNDVPVTITLNARGDLTDIVEIIDSNFDLLPGESKDAAFRITLEYGGKYEGQIGVAFAPQDGGNGVGLSSTIIILAEGPEDPNAEQEEIEEPITEEDEEETTEEEDEEEEVTLTFGGNKDIEDSPKDVDQDKKANPLVGIMIVLIIVGLGAILFLGVMLLLKKK